MIKLLWNNEKFIELFECEEEEEDSFFEEDIPWNLPKKVNPYDKKSYNDLTKEKQKLAGTILEMESLDIFGDDENEEVGRIVSNAREKIELIDEAIKKKR